MATTLTWYGHAAFGLEIEGVKAVIDPFLSDNPAATIKPDEIEAEYILISHGHGDHVGDAIDIAKRTGAQIVSVNEIAVWAQKQGLKAHGQHLGGGHQFPFGYLKLTLAFHGSALPDGSNGGNPCGFLITTPNNLKLYISGDTGLFGDMALIGEEGIDLATVPIGDNFTMGPDDALRAVKMLNPKHVIPVHYNTWDLIAQDPQAWAQEVREQTDAEPHVLSPGESYTI